MISLKQVFVLGMVGGLIWGYSLVLIVEGAKKVAKVVYNGSILAQDALQSTN